MAKDSFKFLTNYLATFNGEDAHVLSEAKEEAVRAIVDFVKSPDIFQVPWVIMKFEWLYEHPVLPSYFVELSLVVNVDNSTILKSDDSTILKSSLLVFEYLLFVVGALLSLIFGFICRSRSKKQRNNVFVA